MKVGISIMVILFFLGQVLIVSGQTNPKSYFVKYITLETDPNPRFVWDYANKIVSFERVSNTKEASCLKNELLKTRLFSKIDTRFVKLKDSNDYQFIVTIIYKLPNPVYKVSKIKLNNFKEVKESKFKKLLDSESLIGKPLSLRNGYPDFEDKIFELVKKSIADETKLEEVKLPWIIFNLNSNNELEVKITRDFIPCN
jgi:hypothetical protein